MVDERGRATGEAEGFGCGALLVPQNPSTLRVRRVLPPPNPTYHPVDLAASAASPTVC